MSVSSLHLDKPSSQEEFKTMLDYNNKKLDREHENYRKMKADGYTLSALDAKQTLISEMRTEIQTWREKYARYDR